MKFIDLFAGVGGFRLALESLGNTCVFSSENNRSCQRVYEDNFGDKPYGDINQINPFDLPDFDILTAGFPCQPFSLNGKKEGFSDKISGTLFFNIVEIVKAKLPKIIFLENVKGIVTHDKGNTIQVIEKALKSLGYNVHTKVLNTYDFGIPQNRERWYCVAFKENYDFEFPIGSEHGSCLEDIIDKNCDSENLKLPDIELKRIDYHFKNYKNNSRVKHSNSHCNPKSKKGKFGIYSYLKPDNALRFHTGDPSKSQIQDDYYVSIKSIAPTLIATRAPKFWDLKRYTSIEECKKLQGFPKKYDFSSVSINTAKKQLGNAVTVKVIERIADQIMKSQYNYDLSKEQKVQSEIVKAES